MKNLILNEAALISGGNGKFECVCHNGITVTFYEDISKETAEDLCSVYCIKCGTTMDKIKVLRGYGKK